MENLDIWPKNYLSHPPLPHPPAHVSFSMLSASGKYVKRQFASQAKLSAPIINPTSTRDRDKGKEMPSLPLVQESTGKIPG